MALQNPLCFYALCRSRPNQRIQGDWLRLPPPFGLLTEIGVVLPLVLTLEVSSSLLTLVLPSRRGRRRSLMKPSSSVFVFFFFVVVVVSDARRREELLLHVEDRSLSKVVLMVELFALYKAVSSSNERSSFPSFLLIIFPFLVLISLLFLVLLLLLLLLLLPMFMFLVAAVSFRKSSSSSLLPSDRSFSSALNLLSKYAS